MASNQKGITVPNIEEGYVLMREYAKNQSGTLSWGVLMELDGVLSFWPRSSQPCYGEARPYGATHPDMLPVSQRTVYKPSDLHSPFPDGTPLAFVGPFYVTGSTDDYKSMMNLFLDPEFSPWKGVLKDFEVITKDNGTQIGIIVKDTDVDPTLMINLMMVLRCAYHENMPTRLAKLRKKYPDENPYVLLLACTQTLAIEESQLSFSTNWGYYLSPAVSVKNFLAGITDPSISEGGTFKGRYAYNRPKLHDIFGHLKDTTAKSVKSKLSEGIEDKYGRIPADAFPVVLATLKELAA